MIASLWSGQYLVIELELKVIEVDRQLFVLISNMATMCQKHKLRSRLRNFAGPTSSMTITLEISSYGGEGKEHPYFPGRGGNPTHVKKTW